MLTADRRGRGDRRDHRREPRLRRDAAAPLGAIVTERGQFPPESTVTLMRELFGEGTREPWARDGGAGRQSDRETGH